MSERRRAKGERRQRRRERERARGGLVEVVFMDAAGRERVELLPGNDPLLRLMRENCSICSGGGGHDGQ